MTTENTQSGDDHRKAAASKVRQLIDLLNAHPGHATARIVEEAEALERAIHAFHMEGIRFRIFNVDRAVNKESAEAMPAGASTLIEEARHSLEAAGFHTRSHQSPT
jgi:hypothetical protein